jgi:hypothetical protein
MHLGESSRPVLLVEFRILSRGWKNGAGLAKSTEGKVFGRLWERQCLIILLVWTVFYFSSEMIAKQFLFLFTFFFIMVKD